MSWTRTIENPVWMKNTPGSLLLEIKNIPPGGVRWIRSGELGEQWSQGGVFLPTHFIYGGGPDIWLVRQHELQPGMGPDRKPVSDSPKGHPYRSGHWNHVWTGPPQMPVFGCDMPCRLFSVGTENGVNWPVISIHDTDSFTWVVENRGDHEQDFLARVAGEVDQMMTWPPR